MFFIACARELGETGFGDFMFAISFTTVLFMISGFGTEELLAREVSRDRDRVHDYLSNVVALKAALSVAGGAGRAWRSCDRRLPERGALRRSTSSASAICLENFGRTWGSVFQAYERMEFISIDADHPAHPDGDRRRRRARAGRAADRRLRRLRGLRADRLPDRRLGAAALRRRAGAGRSIARAGGRLAKAGVPIGILALLSMTLLKLDQVLLSFLSGGDNREVGLYGAAFRLIEATLFISWSFSAAFLPWLSRQGAGQPRAAWRAASSWGRRR